MTAIAINDLSLSNELDRNAMTDINGRGQWHLIAKGISTGAWGGYQQFYSNYRGIKFHGGYLSRHYVKGFRRFRVQTETSYWNQYVRV